MTYWELSDWAIAIAIVVVAVVLSVWLGGVLTVTVLKRASRSPDSAKHPESGQAGGAPSGAPAPVVDDSGQNSADVATHAADDVAFETKGLTGGRWIGKLERFAVTLSIIAGFPAAIAVIVAIKGLGRFPEIRRSSDASEKFVIGTLTSLLVSAVMGGLAVWVMHWFWPDLNY